MNASTLILFSWSRVEVILEKRNFSEVALSADGLVELVYELVNSSCICYIHSIYNNYDLC